MTTTTTTVQFPEWYNEMATLLKQQGKPSIIASPDFYNTAIALGTETISNTANAYMASYGLMFLGEMISEILERMCTVSSLTRLELGLFTLKYLLAPGMALK